MKKAVCFLVFVLVISLFAGCSMKSTDAYVKVDLCNLDSCVLENSVFELSENELQSVIAAKFSAVDADIDPENLTDEDVAVFGHNSALEFEASIVEDIVSHRLVEEYYNYLLENSNTETNENTDEFISSVINKTTFIAKQKGRTVEKFVKENYQMKTDEFKSYLSDLWVNMHIVFAFCDAHDIVCSNVEIEDARKLLKESEEFLCYAANEEIETNMIRYFILTEKVQDHIAASHSQEIEQYTAKIISSLSIFEE